MPFWLLAARLGAGNGDRCGQRWYEGCDVQRGAKYATGVRGGALQGYAHASVVLSRLDDAAWLTWLRATGHTAMALSGHSGGVVRAVYAQATAQFTDVVAVVAISPGEYHHQGLLALHGEAFERTYREAQAQSTPEQPEVSLRPSLPFGATWSARAFVECFHVDNRYSVSAHAADTGCPTLCVFGAAECSGPQELPLCGAAMRRLAEAAYAHVEVAVIEGANHGYEHRERALVPLSARKDRYYACRLIGETAAVVRFFSLVFMYSRERRKLMTTTAAPNTHETTREVPLFVACLPPSVSPEALPAAALHAATRSRSRRLPEKNPVVE